MFQELTPCVMFTDYIAYWANSATSLWNLFKRYINFRASVCNKFFI